jgi:hypothetical protein
MALLKTPAISTDKPDGEGVDGVRVSVDLWSDSLAWSSLRFDNIDLSTRKIDGMVLANWVQCAPTFSVTPSNTGNPYQIAANHNGDH